MMLFKYGKNIVFTHDQILFAIMLYFRAGIFAVQHNVARFDIQGHQLAVFEPALADRNHFPLLRFFLRGIGYEKSTLLLEFFLQHLDEDTIS